MMCVFGGSFIELAARWRLPRLPECEQNGHEGVEWPHDDMAGVHMAIAGIASAPKMDIIIRIAIRKTRRIHR